MWQEYFKSPFEFDDVFIFDSTGRTVANFTELTRFPNHIKFQDSNKKKLIDCINGSYILNHSNPLVFTFDYNELIILLNGRPIIQIRGWGYLTGSGGCKLNSDKAVEIQNSLGEYIVSKFNEK